MLDAITALLKPGGLLFLQDYLPLPPAWVSAELRRRGFAGVKWASDDRQEPRAAECWEEFLRPEGPVRPPQIDRALW